MPETYYMNQFYFLKQFLFSFRIDLFLKRIKTKQNKEKIGIKVMISLFFFSFENWNKDINMCIKCPRKFFIWSTVQCSLSKTSLPMDVFFFSLALSLFLSISFFLCLCIRTINSDRTAQTHAS